MIGEWKNLNGIHMQPASNAVEMVTMKQFALCKPQYCNPIYESNRWEMPLADMDATSNEIDTAVSSMCDVGRDEEKPAKEWESHVLFVL